MLLFLFLMLEMGCARIGFIFNFKNNWTNPRIGYVWFKISLVKSIGCFFFKCCRVACCLLVGLCIEEFEVPEILYFQF